MIKNISGLLLFEEERDIVSAIRILAQKYVDNGSHPKDFKNGKLKTEISTEYSRRKSIELIEKIKKMKKKDLLRLKHYLNIRNNSSNINSILDTFESYNYTKLDNINKFVLQLSKDIKDVKIGRRKTGKISMKMGPKRKTRKKKRGKGKH